METGREVAISYTISEDVAFVVRRYPPLRMPRMREISLAHHDVPAAQHRLV